MLEHVRTIGMSDNNITILLTAQPKVTTVYNCSTKYPNNSTWHQWMETYNAEAEMGFKQDLLMIYCTSIVHDNLILCTYGTQTLSAFTI